MLAGLLIFMMLTLLIGCGTLQQGSHPDPTTTDVTFTADFDGSEQKYVQLTPANFDPAAAHDALIALHGHGSDRWQFVNDPRDECRAARDFAAAHDMVFVSPDYRASTSWMGPAAQADVAQIIGDLQRQHRAMRTFICGGSMGGAACLTFAVLHPELVDGVASMNGTANLLAYENFSDAIAASFGGTREQIPHEYHRRSAEFHAQKLTMPLGLTVSGKDTSVPPHSVRRLANTLKSLNRHVLLIDREDAGHDTNYDDATRILEFMLQHAEPSQGQSR